MQTLTTPRNHAYHFTYDSLGRLTRDEDPATGAKAFARTETQTSHTVTMTTALNRLSTYLVETLADGATRLVDTAPDGTATTRQLNPNATRTTTSPDGTLTSLRETPDPRFAMQAPLAGSLTVRLPSGLTSSLATTRSVTLSDPNNVLSLTSQSDTTTLNGRTATSTYTAATKTFTDRSPANRQSTTIIDAQGRVTRTQVDSLEPVAFSYDPRGRLSTVTQGTGGTARTSTFTYNPQGFLASTTDPLSRTVGFTYDLVGRVLTQTLPDGRVIQTTYDANGNVASITPPSRPTHSFGYTPVDLEDTYTPPDLGIGTVATTYAYNADRQLTTITRPDGQTLGLDYDATSGRLITLNEPRGLTTFTYHPTTGQVTGIGTPGSVSLSYAYDGSLLTGTTWTGPVAGNLGRTYDTDFRVATESVNGGNSVTFQYDPDSLLT